MKEVIYLISKAFDTVNHSILLSKLDLYGIKERENQWFKSYLSKQKQNVFSQKC